MDFLFSPLSMLMELHKVFQQVMILTNLSDLQIGTLNFSRVLWCGMVCANYWVYLSFVCQYEEKFLSDSKERMSSLLVENSASCKECTGGVIVGEPVDKIIEFAKMHDSDMIIISTHGAKGLEKIMLGSVAERVVKRAYCPVLIMNPFKKK